MSLSFTGGPTLGHIETALGSPRARPFYCVVDPERYFPLEGRARWDLGYLGTYSDDRQAAVENLLIQPARTSTRLRFVVAGPQYPEGIEWPPNVERVEHLPPAEHRRFYNSQRFTLNITRADMVRAGYSPSVRLFEAAACGVPIISDEWPGIEEFFVPGSEILLASGPGQVLAFLDLSDEQRGAIAERARRKVLARHTAAHRVDELKTYVEEVQNERAARGRVSS